MATAEILIIKIGKVQQLTFADGSLYESAIRKVPVEAVKIHSLGAESNDVGLKAHHGGVDKALFFMSADAFPALNALLDENFSYQDTAVYGENFVVSALNEDSVCVGDIYQIGSCVVEVSQPRKPCERLSKNTNNPNTQQTVYRSGWSGWYVRVVREGEIQRGDKLILQARPHPDFTIRHLNRLLSAPDTINELEQALALEVLAPAFKRSLHSQLTKLQQKQS
ncbi:molybdenum cofactor sulfurase [Aggregatibacter actinomycetemcomitans serotype b str. SCC4092]|uniref:MOSC domain-containing protein n=1 Tax=Aggregatibacter actinomycetemcomitans TaxID=714 RepID=UPI00022ADE61|nr:MOSC domain-containing protein [Aggregatibacter actinomycetemcomitans]KND84257.1 molybdenum cofactor sulfurase [Aggregatibacter actinomycetemcomitans serotype b str. SCC1398]KOE53592.1 molybdenum cofactor sulfurase [Aggregatibacter actinomycetemcomitans serotype b str. SCC4092]